MIDANVLYLSGKMSGVKDSNFPKFNQKAKQLRDCGFTVINPAETIGGQRSMDRSWYIEKDIHDITMVDAVALMHESWQTSNGAQLEVLIAENLEKPVYMVDSLLDNDPKKLNVSNDQVLQAHFERVE